MTDKEFVRKKYPSARCVVFGSKFETRRPRRIVSDRMFLGDESKTAELAWASAAERIRKAEEVKP